MKLHRLIRQHISDIIKSHHLESYYSNNKAFSSILDERYIIYMCDGRIHHGGLSDRLWGMISTYEYCLQHNLKFKALWNFPYNLENILQPNLYDWRINENDVIYDKAYSHPVVVSNRLYVREQVALAHKRLKKDYRQLHVYTNMRYAYPSNYKHLFNELFKPTQLLERAIADQKKHLPETYVSLTFRFQQLLGDLKEKNFKTLVHAEQEKLIEKCFKYIEYVHHIHPQISKFLVTADSTTFLDLAKQKYSYIHTIPGKIVHMDYDGYNSGLDVHLKSFVDMFMIAGAKIVYSAILPPLYQSEFPYSSSLITGTRYIDIYPEMIENQM